MLEIVPHNDLVTGFKTGSGWNDQVVMWTYSYALGDVLFDAGCPNAREELAAALKDYPIKRLFISHAHEDHVGVCSILEDEITIYATAEVAEELRNPIELAEFFRAVWGQPEPVSKIEVMPPAFEVANLHFDVIPLPGHNANMVGFHEADKKWLFSADAVPVPSRKKMGMPDENIPQTLATLEMIQTLDLEILFDSHRGPIEKPSEHIQTRIDYLRDFQREVKKLHASGKSVAEIQEALGLEGPWYLELTKERFGINYVIESVLRDG
ncbi:MAG: MBL fold metallo-hydrolase [Candidatus Thorarchaeota archaeon]|nr:MBL fold metallo-hydrolase [Candidatus Thorarchaeota archaeon]